MASDTATFSVRLPEKLKDELEALAEATQRSRAFLVKEAIESYVRDRQVYVAELMEAKKSAGSGVLHSKEQIFAWMDSWGEHDELPSPKPDILPNR